MTVSGAETDATPTEPGWLTTGGGGHHRGRCGRDREVDGPGVCPCAQINQ